MAACRFRVTGISLQKNVRGQAMRRLRFAAVPSDVFVSDEALPPGVTTPEPEGEISMLVSESFAARFTLGEEVDVVLRDRD